MNPNTLNFILFCVSRSDYIYYSVGSVLILSPQDFLKDLPIRDPPSLPICWEDRIGFSQTDRPTQECS